MPFNFSLPFCGKDNLIMLKQIYVAERDDFYNLQEQQNTTTPPPKKIDIGITVCLILLHYDLIYKIHENSIFYALLCYSGAVIFRLKYNPLISILTY